MKPLTVNANPLLNPGRVLIVILGLAVALVMMPPMTRAAAENELPISQPAQTLSLAVEAYDQGRYAEAAGSFLALVKAGYANGELFYNLGNCYLKSEDLGQAILWYERARRWLPSDPDLSYNLDYARSLRKDVHEAEDPVLLRVLCFPGLFLSQVTVQYALVAANALFWLGLLARRRTRVRALRSVQVLTLSSLVLALCLAPAAALGLWTGSAQRAGIVLTATLPVRSGLGPAATELFALHAGTRVKVEEQRDEHVRVRFGKEKTGWVPAESIGLI